MTAYPMLYTQRARIVNSAVRLACANTGAEQWVWIDGLPYDPTGDGARWAEAASRYYPNRLYMERWPL